MSRDLAFGGAGLLLAAGYFAMAATLPQSLLSDTVGPQGLPRMYAVALAALSIALIVTSLRKSPVSLPSSLRLDRAAGMLLVGVVYVAVVAWVGYAVSIGALILAAAWYQGGVLNRRMVLVAVCGALFFWLLFVAVLGVRHPVGALFQF